MKPRPKDQSTATDWVKMLICCCCKANRCALLLCAFEILLSLIAWYELATLVSQTFTNMQLQDVLLLVFISSWLITLFTATFTLVMAQKRQRSEFALPRLIQQSGLLVIGFLGALIILAYFSGGASTINNCIISIYEKLLLDHTLDANERREAHDALKYCFMALILVDFFFIIYMGFGLCVTKRFHTQLKQREVPSNSGRSAGPSSAGHYDPLPSNAPPPYNPGFKSYA